MYIYSLPILVACFGIQFPSDPFKDLFPIYPEHPSLMRIKKIICFNFDLKQLKSNLTNQTYFPFVFFDFEFDVFLFFCFFLCLGPDMHIFMMPRAALVQNSIVLFWK